MLCACPAYCAGFSTGGGPPSPLPAEASETLNGEQELTPMHPIDEAGNLYVSRMIISISSRPHQAAALEKAAA